MWYPAANSSATHSLITMHTPPALSLTIQQTAGCTWQPEKEATQSTFWILSPRKRYTHKTQEYLASCNLLIIQIQLYLLHRTQTIDTKRLLTANSQHFVTAVITTCDETCKMPIYLHVPIERSFIPYVQFASTENVRALHPGSQASPLLLSACLLAIC